MRPALLILEPKNIRMFKYPYPGDVSDISVAELQKFITDFKAGNLKPQLKSEEIPEQETVNGLTTIVGKTYDRIVNAPDTDVFVLYYAESCNKFNIIHETAHWADLAKSVEKISNLIIAQYDVGLNEAEGFQIEGFPKFILHTPAKNYEHSKLGCKCNTPKLVNELVAKYGDTKYALENNGSREQEVHEFTEWFSRVSEYYQEAMRVPLPSRTLGQKLRSRHFMEEIYHWNTPPEDLIPTNLLE